MNSSSSKKLLHGLRSHSRISRLGAVALAASVGIAAGTAGIAGASKPKLQQFNIIIGSPVANVNTLPLWYGISSGIFAKYGLNVKLVTLNNSSNVSAAIQSNSITIGTETPIGMFQAYAAGEQIEAIADFDNGLPGGLVVSDKYMAAHGLTATSTPTQVAQALNGSTQASSSLSTTGQALLIFRSLGVVPTYKVANVSSTAAAVTALGTGQADWYFANYPTPLLSVQAGVGTVLMNSKNVKVLRQAQINQVISANDAYAAAHPALMKRIVKAISESVQYVGAHEQKVVTTLQQNLPGYTRPNLLKSIAAVEWAKSPVMTEAIWRDSYAIDVKSGQLAAGGVIVKENGIWTNAFT